TAPAVEPERLLRDPDPLRPGPLEEGIEAGDLEGQVVELLARVDRRLLLPMGELDPRPGDRVLHEGDLGVVLGDLAASLELEPQDPGVEREALFEVAHGDRGVQEPHRTDQGGVAVKELAAHGSRPARPSRVTETAPDRELPRALAVLDPDEPVPFELVTL